MKNLIRKLLGVLLILLILLSTLTGCYKDGKYVNGDLSCPIEFAPSFFAKVESDTSIFDRGDVDLNFSYGLYILNGAYTYTIEEQKLLHCFNEDGVVIEDNFAIYISNSEDLVFEYDDNGRIIDYENKVNAKIWKFISFEEAFATDYGFTTSFMNIDYHHSEKITIPSEFFDAREGTVFIHIVCLRHYINEQNFGLGYGETMIEMEYRLTCDKIVLQ